MGAYLGIDTSNYTTSVAIYSDSGDVISQKRLLSVETGECGLMQSKAVFLHTRQLPEITEAAFSRFNGNISAVCASSAPRTVERSYMPVFLVGVAAARSIAAAMKVPFYTTSHQVGHILAAVRSAGCTELLRERFIAFHLSGGTSEALLVTPDEQNTIKCECVARSLDLKAGQAVDRVGVMLGLPFPCGAAIDKLAQSGVLSEKIKPTLKGCDCCLSGVQNKCELMHKNGASDCDVARYAIEYIYAALKAMTDKLHSRFGALPTLYAGGVMSNSLIRERLSQNGGIFCEPEYSGDNATGVAYAAYLLDKRGRSDG